MDDELPFDLSAENLEIGGHTIQLVRPADPYCAIECYLEEEDRGPDGFSCELWPSAHALALMLLQAEPAPDGPLLELGCGLGLASLAAAQRGLQALASDAAGLCLEMVAESARRNGLDTKVQTLRYAWGEALPRRFPLVVGADLLYEEQSHQALWNSLEQALAHGGQVWLTDPERPATAAFFADTPAGWQVERSVLAEGLALYRLCRRSPEDTSP